MTHSPKPSHFYRTVTLMLLLIFGGFMVSDMYLPALPHLSETFHTTSKNAQFTIAIYFIGACISMLLLGPISDRIGRRKIVLIGMSFMIIGTFLCWYTAHFEVFLIGRIMQGLGAGAGFAVMRTAMRDMVQGNDLAHILAYITMIVGICPAIAPALGGILVTHFNWHIIFLLTLIYYIILFIFMVFLFPETLAKATQIKNRNELVIHHAACALSKMEFVCYCLTTATVYAGMMAYVTASPILIEVHLHFSAFAFGLITLGIVISGQLSKLYNRLYLNKKGYRYMMWVGMGLMWIGSLMMFLCALLGYMNIYTVVIPMVFYGNGMGILFPNISTAFLTLFTTIVGMASALYGTIQLGGGFIGSAIMSHLSESTLLPLSSCLMIFITIATIALYNARRLEKITQNINQNMTI